MEGPHETVKPHLLLSRRVNALQVESLGKAPPSARDFLRKLSINNKKKLMIAEPALPWPKLIHAFLRVVNVCSVREHTDHPLVGKRKEVH
jgi:hypothetical protein